MPVLSVPFPADIMNAVPTLGGIPVRIAIAFRDVPAPEEPLHLTVEVRQQVAEILRDANCVTRPERAAIVKFVAGNRSNPCPGYGNVGSIKLSSNIRNYRQDDNTTIQLIEEEHFEMNFQTGYWRCIKRHRRAE
ncbi:PREDICTED: negative elongation factor A-like [Papilio polytes]|uniref:negative elongation factor A-like n=1 Tax=Papilio polytes TaxID=76194 RepID=UPI000675F217|nr:PREDICTED: negative elongation factor A-like [Papilio polytes]